MAYDEYLEERISRILQDQKVEYTTKKMMGGLCYMMDEKMLCGIVKNEVMARINPEIYEESLKVNGVNEMNFTGRAMRGFVFVTEDAYDLDEDLEFWIQKCIEYNPFAKKSKKKKKKI